MEEYYGGNVRLKAPNQNKQALIMAGGTGGHVIPGLEIARSLQNDGYTVSWLGTKWGLEAKLVPEQGLKLYCLPVWGVRGKNLAYKVLAPFRILAAILYSIYILKITQARYCAKKK